MRKIIFLFFILSTIIFADNESLKTKHQQMLHFFGDSPLAAGNHSFSKEGTKQIQLYSNFRTTNAFSRFWENEGWELYHSVLVFIESSSITIHNTYKLTQDFETQTLEYYVVFEKKKDAIISKVTIDRDASSFEEKYYDTILSCTTKQGVALIPEVMKCMAQGSKTADCVLDAAQGQAANDLVQCILKGSSLRSGVYWRIFLKPQGMGFVSAKPFGAKDSCSTTTGCTHFVIPSGYKITIEATPAPGYKFEYWQYKGNLLSLDVKYSFIPSAGGDLVAHFTKK